MAEAMIYPTTSAKKGRWAGIKEMFAEIDQILAQVKQDQEETARQREQIRANFATLDQMRAKRLIS